LINLWNLGIIKWLIRITNERTMRKLIRYRIIKLKSQSKWIVRIFALAGIIFWFIFAFISHPISGTNAENVSNSTSSYIHELEVDWINTISICDPSSNGTKCITMKDMNQWATEAGVWCIRYSCYDASQYYSSMEECVDLEGYDPCMWFWRLYWDTFSSEEDCENRGESLYQLCVAENGTWMLWNHYQWWNNHGFAPCTDSDYCRSFPNNESLGSKAIDCTDYGPWSRLDTGIFITNSVYCTTQTKNYNMRWWWNDWTWNNRWYDETNNTAVNATGRQWPCDTWYHVPSIWEWNQVLEYRAEENNIALEDDWHWLKYNSDLDWLKFQEDFKIPFVGYRDSSTNASVWYNAKLWSSSPDVGNDRARNFYLDLGTAGANNNYYFRGYAFSVRCFKDSYLSFPSCSGWQHQATWDVCVYDDKDIVIQVTATGNSTQKIRINKYFANNYTIDWWDWLWGEATSTNDHTYSTPWTYTIILSLTWWADRWTFQSSYVALITKNSYTTVTWVLIKYMPSLASGFWTSDIWVWDNFFRYFNYNWAITSLPDWSFDTSNIESVWNYFFYYFNNGWAITGLPDWSFDTSNIWSAWTYFFSNFNQNWAITYLPNSFTLNSTWATKSNWYKNAFNSPNYTINRNVSDLVADISTPSSDMDTFSDNQPWRCGAPSNWLVNVPTQCPSTITITAVPASYWTVDSGSVLADYWTQITLSWNTVIIWNTTITATPKNWDYEFSGRDNSCGNTLITWCNIVARFRSISVGINYTVTFNSDWW